jgi:YD repeat-containing protein
MGLRGVNYFCLPCCLTRTDPLTRDESFAYDLLGNVTSWTDRKGQVTTYEYDALNRHTFVLTTLEWRRRRWCDATRGAPTAPVGGDTSPL